MLKPGLIIIKDYSRRVFSIFKVFKAKKASILAVKAALLGTKVKVEKMLKIGLMIIGSTLRGYFGILRPLRPKGQPFSCKGHTFK